MSSVFTFKKGDTFTVTVRYTPPKDGLANWIGGTVTSKVLDAKGSRWTLDCTLAEDGLSAVVIGTPSNTVNWAIGQAKWDVRWSLGGTVVHTQTATFSVVEQITTDS